MGYLSPDETFENMLQSGASPGLGEGKNLIFFRFGYLHVAKLGEFGGMLPREFFLKRCNLVCFRCVLIRFCLYFFQKLLFFI